jgi:hypothetical protein
MYQQLQHLLFPDYPFKELIRKEVSVFYSIDTWLMIKVLVLHTYVLYIYLPEFCTSHKSLSFFARKQIHSYPIFLLCIILSQLYRINAFQHCYYVNAYDCR